RLGEYWTNKGDARQAIEHLQTATRTGSKSAETYRILGQAWMLEGNFSQAESSLKTAIGIDQRASVSHRLLAEVYRRTDRNDLAKREYELSLKLQNAPITPRNQDSVR